MAPERKFTRVLRQDGKRLLILSTCDACGATQLASAQDGSLQEWEDAHACEESLAPKKQSEASKRDMRGRARRT